MEEIVMGFGMIYRIISDVNTCRGSYKLLKGMRRMLVSDIYLVFIIETMIEVPANALVQESSHLSALE
jgi:hypothetical protein